MYGEAFSLSAATASREPASTPGVLLPYQPLHRNDLVTEKHAIAPSQTQPATLQSRPTAERFTQLSPPRRPLSPLLHSTASENSKVYNPVLSPSTASPRRAFAVTSVNSPPPRNTSTPTYAAAHPSSAKWQGPARTVLRTSGDVRDGQGGPSLGRADDSTLRRLTEAEAAELSNAFTVFDFGQAGTLSFRQAEAALCALRIQNGEGTLARELAEFGKDEDEQISFDEFFEIGSTLYRKRSPREEAKFAFQAFDLDGTGKISFRNLQAAARGFGVTVHEEELRSMIHEFDLDGDGMICMPEFERILLGYEDEIE